MAVALLWQSLLLLITTLTHAQSDPNDMRFQRLLADPRSAEQTALGVLKAIVQDQDGFMWFATENGLVRYDSEEYRFYYADRDNPHSLSSSFITDLLVDHAGVLWLATANGLNRYNSEQDNFTVYSHQEDDPQSIAAPYISALAEDAQHNLYLATGAGLSVMGLEREHFQNHLYQDGETTGPSGRELRSVLVDSKQRIWIGTTGAGLNQYHPQSQTFSYFPIPVSQTAPTGVDSIEFICEDHLGDLWLATHGGGLLRMNPERGYFHHYLHDPKDPKSIGSNTLRSILLDSEQQIWIATDHGGLALYDREHDYFHHTRHSVYDTSTLSSNQLRTLYEDPQGNLWVGNFPGGVNFYDRAKAAFANLTHQPDNHNSLIHNGVLSILEDDQGIIWFGTEGGLSAYNPENDQFRHYQHDPDDPFSLRFNAIPALAMDRNNKLWVGAWSGGLHRFERDTEKFYSYLPEPGNPHSLASEFVWQIVVDGNNHLWVANTEGAGLNHFNPETGRFTRYAHDPDNPNSLSYDQVRALIVDHRETLWLGTPHGLDHFNPRTEQFTRFRHDPSDPHSISDNNITALFEDSQQRIWIGTDDGQVNIFQRSENRFIQVNQHHGLPRVRVSSIVEDRQGHIWLGTSNGLAQVHPDDFSVRMYNTSDGLAGNDHNRNAAMVDSQGNVYFGSIQGVSIFNPHQLPLEGPPPATVITELRLANQRITPHSHPDILERTIEKTDRVQLSHQHTTLALGFSALSFHSSHRNQYAYKLEGFDSRWNNVGHSRTATYTNLNPGRYVFQVKAANSQGVWSKDPTKLTIVVTPPPWRTIWAYLFYSLAGLALISLIIHLKSKRLELDKERAVNARLLNLDRIKDTFLANTSHELRTPLNGIIGLAEASLDGSTGPVNQDMANSLGLIVASGRRLSSLINDILDHSKLSDNTLELNQKPVDLYSSVVHVFSLLQPLADEKHMLLYNRVPKSQHAIWADPNRLQQILINLVGNGIKYANGGMLTVTSLQGSDDMQIVVEDTGVGIPPAELNTVFQPFKQLEGDDNRAQGGTGLGLAITKQLVELHQGKIWVESIPGDGSRFIFTMPLTTEGAVPLSPDDSMLIRRVGSTPSAERRSTQRVNHHKLHEKLPPLANASRFRILIVDDDPVNRLVLRSIMVLHHYQVVEASNGEQALAAMESGTRIDLILLDVMMPEISGYEVCRRLRQRFPLAALPIIFLTAKRADDELLRAFAVGGNELLCKPVEKYELLAKVRTYLELLRAYRGEG